MTILSRSMRDLARRLLGASRPTSPPGRGGPTGADATRVHEAVAVCEKLRAAVTRFAGPDGFASLLHRALVLARLEAPALGGVRVSADCHLEGLEEALTGPRGSDAAVALAANLLMLLVTFIGEPLTLRLLQEAWPDADLGILPEQRPPT